MGRSSVGYIIFLRSIYQLSFSLKLVVVYKYRRQRKKWVLVLLFEQVFAWYFLLALFNKFKVLAFTRNASHLHFRQAQPKTLTWLTPNQTDTKCLFYHWWGNGQAVQMKYGLQMVSYLHPETDTLQRQAVDPYVLYAAVVSQTGPCSKE